MKKTLVALSLGLFVGLLCLTGCKKAKDPNNLTTSIEADLTLTQQLPINLDVFNQEFPKSGLRQGSETILWEGTIKEDLASELEKVNLNIDNMKSFVLKALRVTPYDPQDFKIDQYISNLTIYFAEKTFGPSTTDAGGMNLEVNEDIMTILKTKQPHIKIVCTPKARLTHPVTLLLHIVAHGKSAI